MDDAGEGDEEQSSKRSRRHHTNSSCPPFSSASSSSSSFAQHERVKRKEPPHQLRLPPLPHSPLAVNGELLERPLKRAKGPQQLTAVAIDTFLCECSTSAQLPLVAAPRCSSDSALHSHSCLQAENRRLRQLLREEHQKRLAAEAKLQQQQQQQHHEHDQQEEPQDERSEGEREKQASESARSPRLPAVPLSRALDLTHAPVSPISLLRSPAAVSVACGSVTSSPRSVSSAACPPRHLHQLSISQPSSPAAASRLNPRSPTVRVQREPSFSFSQVSVTSGHDGASGGGEDESSYSCLSEMELDSCASTPFDASLSHAYEDCSSAERMQLQQPYTYIQQQPLFDGRCQWPQQIHPSQQLQLQQADRFFTNGPLPRAAPRGL